MIDKTAVKRTSLHTALGLLVLIGLVAAGDKLVETNSAGFIKIKQAAGSGTMSVHDEPGMFLQLLGSVHEYKRAATFYFSDSPLDEKGDEPIPVRFNDGATALVTGNVRFELPAEPDKLLRLHDRFRSYERLKYAGIKQVVTESVILTAEVVNTDETGLSRV